MDQNFDKMSESLYFFFSCYPMLNLNSLSYDVYRVKNRVIYNPCEPLKRAQRYLKKYLNKFYPLEITTEKCAKIHSGKKWILKADIKDFYGSVKLEHIRKIMRKVFDYFEIADYMTDLVTIGNKLPTGSPTSAHIANACFLPLDKRIKEYCIKHDVIYSRYMDDLTFSSDNKEVLNSVEDYVSDIVLSSGFKLNDKKTRYISANKQQNILGLVVNKEVRIPKTLRKNIRAMIHYYAMSRGYICPRDKKYALFSEVEINRLRGYMNYIKSADLKTYEKLINYAHKLNVLKDMK